MDGQDPRLGRTAAVPATGPEAALDEAHPRGTLAIVALYGVLFALGWLVLYFLVFLPRGTITP